MIELATPISHLFDDPDYEDVINRSSEVLECRDRSIDYANNLNKQSVFHCELQPIHALTKKDWIFIRKIQKTKPHLKLVTFHIASCCDLPKIQNRMFELGGREYTRDEMKNFARENFKRIKQIFGNKVDIAVENNNFYPTKAYRDVTDAEFIHQIVCENDIKFLFDIAHAKVTCFNRNINFEKYKNDLPLEKVIQVHICSYGIDDSRNLAFDAHDFPNDEELLEVKKIISIHSHVKYLTVEYYRDIKNLTNSLKKVREIINVN